MRYGLLLYTADDYGCCYAQHDVVITGTDLINFGIPSKPLDLWANAGNGQYSVPTYIDKTSVVFYLKRVKYNLTVVMKTDDGELPDGTLLTFSSKTSQFNKMWIQANPKPISEVASESKDGYVTYTLTYYACTPVSLTCGANSCYNFVKWDETNPPNTDPTDPSQATNPNLSVTMTKDRYVTADFQVPFRLVSASVLQWPRWTGYIDLAHTVKLTGNLDPNDPGGGDPSAAEPIGQTFGVNVLFTGGNPANGPSVRIPGVFGHGDLYTTWPQTAPAYVQLNFNKPAYYTADPFLFEETANYTRQYAAAFSCLTSGSGTKVLSVALEWANNSSELAWKGQNLTLYTFSINTGGSSPQYLCGNPRIRLSTENPDIQWYYTNTHVKDKQTSCSWPCNCCYCSVFTYWMACVYNYEANQVYKANSTAVRDNIDAGNDVPAYDIAFNCDGDGDGDNGSGHTDDAGGGAQNKELMADCPHVWNHLIAAGAINRLDADLSDFPDGNVCTGCTMDYGVCGGGAMWYADIGNQFGTQYTPWGVWEACQDMAANPTHYTMPGTPLQFGVLPSTTWPENSSWWLLFASPFQSLTEPWASGWENRSGGEVVGLVPAQQRHLGSIANFMGNYRAPDWWGAAESSSKLHYDNDPTSRIDIEVDIK